MNKERLIQLAEALENEQRLKDEFDFKFYMPNYLVKLENMDKFGVYTSCGTAGCIAGLTIVMFAPQEKPVFAATTEFLAAQLLGLNADTRNALFTPAFYEYDMNVFDDDDFPVIDLRHVTAAAAAKVVRDLVETGQVDWSIVEDDLWAEYHREQEQRVEETNQ